MATNQTWIVLQGIMALTGQPCEKLLNDVVIEMEHTESFCDSVRRSAAAAGNIRSLMDKRRIVSLKDHLDLYSAGFNICLRLNNASTAWLWAQKGKARGLSDTFGFRALVPDYILDRDLLRLYNRERKSFIDAIHASPEEYIAAARNAEKDREELLKIPVLAQVVALRGGAFNNEIEASELDKSLSASNMSKDRVKYVDCFIPHKLRDSDAGDIFLLVRSLDGTTIVRKSPTSESGWIHYHGHAVYTKGDILKSALVLSGGTDHLVVPESVDFQPEAGRNHLTVPKIFEMPVMDNAPHFTIIARDSGPRISPQEMSL